MKQLNFEEYFENLLKTGKVSKLEDIESVVEGWIEDTAPLMEYYIDLDAYYEDYLSDAVFMYEKFMGNKGA